MSLADFLRTLMRYGLEQFGRYYSFYPAEVVGVDDPERRGRIKVRVPALNLENNEPHPAWVIPLSSPVASGSGYGSLNVPRVGENVWVMFRYGELKEPMYLPFSFLKKDFELPGFNDVEDRGFVTRGGHTFKVRDAEGEELIELKHAKGALITIDADGVLLAQTSSGDLLKLDPSGAVTLLHRGGAEVELTSDTASMSANEQDRLTVGRGQASLLSKATMDLKSKLITLAGSVVKLGGSTAVHPLVFGDVLLAYMQADAIWKAAHVHSIVSPSPGTPTSPPVVPPPPMPGSAMLSKTVMTK